MATTETPRFRRKSWTVPADLIDEIEREVPHGKMSAYVTEALRRQRQRDTLASRVEELVEEAGPPDEARVARFREAMR
jgi:hypothetical protein